MTAQILRLFAAAVLMTAMPGLAFGQGAAVEPVRVGDDLLDKRDDYGARAIDDLRETLREDVEQALDRAGLLGSDAPDITITLVLENAWPNRPTREQMRAEPGLSYLSVSRGGADLSAILYDREGQEIGRIAYDWRTPFIEDSAHRSTWSDAERTFERFANRLVEAVQEAETRT